MTPRAVADQVLPAETGPFPGETADRGTLSPIQAVLLRKWSILALAVLVALVVGVYVKTLPNHYSSEVAVAIDARQLKVINAESLLANQMLDSEQLRTEMEPLSGIGLARSVVQSLSLATNPEFCAAPSRLSLARLGGRTAEHAVAAPPCSVPVDYAARELMGRVSARTDSTSYVIRIGAEAGTPVLAANIANAYARAFIAGRKDAAYAVAVEARSWLVKYAEQLREEVVSADAQVALYETQHGLTLLHGGTLTSQTLVEMNTSLTALTGEIAQRRSAVEQLQSAAHGGGNLSASSLTGQSPLLGQLLSRLADNAEQQARLRTTYGNLHPDVMAARAQATRLQQQVNVEVGKTVRNASAELASMESRRAELQARVTSLQKQIGVQGEADVQLAALQRQADSKRLIYQSILSRQMELEAQHGIAQADAQIVAEALPPLIPSSPHRSMLVAGAFLAALGLGSTLAIPLSLLSRRFRDAEHIEDEVGVPVLGMFPRPPPGVAPHDVVQSCIGSPEAEAVLRILPHILRDRTDAGDGRNEHAGRPIRSLVVASALPGEGKTSFSIALGRAAAQLGVSVLLIDCDLRRPSIERLVGGDARVASRPAQEPGREVEISLAQPRIMSLSAMMPDRPRFVSGQDVAKLLQTLSGEYQLILLDAPPILVLADAMSLVAAAEATLLVVDWRTTPRRAVAAAVQLLRRQGATLLGAVTSKADLRRDSQSSSHYFHYRSHYFEASTTPLSG